MIVSVKQMNCDPSLQLDNETKEPYGWTDKAIDSLLHLVYRNRIGLFADYGSSIRGSMSNSPKGVASVVES